MRRSFEIEIVTPEATELRARATAIRAPAWEGYLGVLAGHAALVCALTPGCLTVRQQAEENGEERSTYYALRGGFMQVGPERVVVIADEVARGDAVDAAKVKRELAELEKAPPLRPGAAAAAEAKGARPEEGAAPGAGQAALEARAKARDEAREQAAEARRWAKARLETVALMKAGE